MLRSKIVLVGEHIVLLEGNRVRYSEFDYDRFALADKYPQQYISGSYKLWLHLPSAQGNPVGNCLGLGSVWVSSQV